MRSRYYKLARRRVQWEYDDPHVHSWRHHKMWAARFYDRKPLSSTSGSKEPEKSEQHEAGRDSDFRTVYKDFTSFREAVDRAIERDPYGTLFGRRLQSPPTANNSSWTSFSWLFDPKEIKEDPALDGADGDKPASQVAPSKPAQQVKVQPTSFASADVQDSVVEDEYEYDPISMRKVPVKKRAAEAASSSIPVPPEPTRAPSPPPVSPIESIRKNETQQTLAPTALSANGPTEVNAKSTQPTQHQPAPNLFKSLFFQEHGVDIPVKTYKPHKVFGHAPPEKPVDTKSNGKPTTANKPSFDSSRKQQARDLLARVKGNSIDTTALYTDAQSVAYAEPEPKTIVNDTVTMSTKPPRTSPAPDDSLPLFSGTVHEAKGVEKKKPRSEWLTIEGFQTPAITIEKSNPEVHLPVKKFTSKLETSYERLERATPTKSPGLNARLESALDRRVSAPKTSSQSEPRKTSRAKLEADFEARQSAAADEADFSPKRSKSKQSPNKLTKTLDNVWNHIREHPDGIVAKTMRSMTNINENYKKYLRPEPAQDLTAKLTFKDSSLSRVPSIYKKDAKPKPIQTFTPSSGVLEALRQQERRSLALREANEKAEQALQQRDSQIRSLAQDIKSVYEQQYGIIDAAHRQPELNRPQHATNTPADGSRLHPLKTATVKPGVVTNPIMVAHVTQFEPRFAKLWDNVKQTHFELRKLHGQTQELQTRHAELRRLAAEGETPKSVETFKSLLQGTRDVRRALHETKNTIRAIETGRPDVAWSASRATDDSDVLSTGAKVSESPTSRNTAQPANVVPEPIHTPSGSPIWNDEQIPPMENLRPNTFDSPYLILSYNLTAGKVDFSPLNEPMTGLPKSDNALQIFGRLENASEFLKHFQDLSTRGYSLFNGTETMLIFKKTSKQPDTLSSEPKVSSSKILLGTPFNKVGADPARPKAGKQAATVLEEMPSIEPQPGPAAPTAPPIRAAIKDVAKMRRQENVFSGTIRPAASTPESKSQTEPAEPQPTRESLWKRFVRGVRRVLLTTVALGAGAYTIGVVSEGLGAHAQQRMGIENAETPGPRKRIVMTGTRPGIYSAESSR